MALKVEAPARFLYYCRESDSVVWHNVTGPHAVCSNCGRKVPASEVITLYATSEDWRGNHVLLLPDRLLPPEARVTRMFPPEPASIEARKLED